MPARPLLLFALLGAVAAFSGSTGEAARQGFCTQPTVLPATNVTGTSATLNGSITYCDGSPTFTYHFNYGPANSKGLPFSTPDATANPGPVSATVSGLTPQTDYLYELEVTEPENVVDCCERFTTTTETAPAPPEGKDPDNPSADLAVQVTLTEGATTRQVRRQPAAAGAARATIGQTLTYTAVVFNHGPRQATAVRFTDTLPSQVGFQSVSTSQGSCTGGQSVSCSLGSLGDGVSAVVRIVGVATTSGTATNVASVSNADQPDANPGNNTSTTAIAQVAPPAPPAPVYGQTFNVRPVSGTVLIRLPGTTAFVPLTDVQSVPEGSELDTNDGVVEVISAASPANDLQTAQFATGRFVLSYEPTAITPRRTAQTPDLVTNLRLSDPLDCTVTKAKPKKSKKPKGKKGKSGRTLDQTAPKKKVRTLWGNGSGTFRTRGKYSAASVRGTVWLTQDTCAGTLVRVREGVVEVFDFTLRKTVTVNAGESYFAAAPKR